MDKILVQLGPLTITWYAFLIVVGMLIGIAIAIKEAKIHKMDSDAFIDYVVNVIIIGVIGARTWYVVFNFAIYQDNLLSVFAVWNGGLAIHGGLLAGLLYTIYYCKKHNKNILMFGDIAAPSLLIAQSIGRWGNFVNQEAHGGQTTKGFLQNILHLPNFIVQGMYIDGAYWQPTFLYESIWNLIGFIIIIFLRKKYRFRYGTLLAIYLMWYGFIRTIIEQMRTDALLFGPIKVAQLTSAIMFISGVVILIILYKRNKSTNQSK